VYKTLKKEKKTYFESFVKSGRGEKDFSSAALDVSLNTGLFILVNFLRRKKMQ